jgi:hypothetical protein
MSRDRVTTEDIHNGNWIYYTILQLVTANKNYALTFLNTLQTSLGHIESSQSVTVFISRCFEAASNRDILFLLGSRTVPVLQLLTSQYKHLTKLYPQLLSSYTTTLTVTSHSQKQS